MVLALFLGSTFGLMQFADAEPVSSDDAPANQPFEEDNEEESQAEIERDDETAFVFVVPIAIAAAGSLNHLNDDRLGTVEAATRELHAPRAPPVSRT
jgi:hypothetical protein